MRRWDTAPIVTTVLLIVAGGAVVYGVLSVTTSLRRTSIEDRREAAGLAAGLFDATFDSATAQIRTVARALEPWTGTPREENRATGSIVGPPYTDGWLITGGLWVVDPRGQVRVADPGHAALLGTPFQGGHVREALAGVTSISGVVEDPVTGRPQIQVATPLHDRLRGGEITGALVGGMPLRDGELAALLATVPVPAGTDMTLVGPHGAALPIRARLDSIERDDPNLEAALEAGQGVGVTEGEAGVEQLTAVAPVEEGWSIVLRQPLSEFDQPFRLPTIVAAVGALAFVILGVGTVLSEERRVRRARATAERAKRSLLAVAGHELRTPLTVVRGMSQTLLARWSAVPDDQRRDLVGTIQRQARTLEHLVERLLYAAQLEAGVAGTIQNRALDVSAMVKEAASHASGVTELHTVEADVEPALRAEADPKALDQVLFHLLDNAIKYSPAGGTIQVSGYRARGRVVIEVEDEGVGLPSDTRAIFEAFGQREDVDTRIHDEGGVGLGLYIVRTLVELMGGNVRAEHRDGGGARFVVALQATRGD